jgi:hypothetical protein
MLWFVIFDGKLTRKVVASTAVLAKTGNGAVAKGI